MVRAVSDIGGPSGVGEFGSGGYVLPCSPKDTNGEYFFWPKGSTIEGHIPVGQPGRATIFYPEGSDFYIYSKATKRWRELSPLELLALEADS